MVRTISRLIPTLVLSLALVALAACGNDDDGDTGAEAGTLRVVTTVAPLRNIVENVVGDRATVVGLVPDGADSHTFEPPPSAVVEIERADIIIINGLNLEEPTLALAEANKRSGVDILMLGNETVSPDQYVYDFSFPEDEGNPNPHLWTEPTLVIRYAELVRDAMIGIDPDARAYYEANTAAFVARLESLDAAIMTATGTISSEHRKLLTYHDSFPYFAPRYGFEVIGAIQPSDFSEPSPQEVAAIIGQVRESGVPAIFGSEVFPSRVLDTIAREAGAVQVSTLSDDELPGNPGDPDNTFVAMMVENVVTIVEALGGDASALDGFDVTNTWIPFDEFESS
jgi:ABC-type Zn uptake system ZnuABC Zn-binding protein ZnuA